MANNRELSQFGSFVGVNDSNKKITIGSTIVEVTTESLQLLGDGYVSGNLGIGSTDPDSRLSINGISQVVYDNNGSIIINYDPVGVSTNIHPQSVAVDSSNNIYVAGELYYSSYPAPIPPHIGFLSKFDIHGNILWKKFYTYPEIIAGNYSVIACVKVDSDDNIIVTYSSYPSSSPNTNNVCFLVKLNSSGNILWQKSYGENVPANRTKLRSVGVGSTGNVYAVGISSFSSIDSYSDQYDGLIIKFDKDGNSGIKSSFGRPGGNQDTGLSVGIGTTSDNVYVVGSKSDVGVILKYDKNLNNIWKKYIYADGGDGYVSVLDSNENSYIFHPYSGAFIILKIDKDGNLLWEKNLSGNAYYSPTTPAVGGAVCDSSDSDNIYGCFTTNETGIGAYDLLIFKMNTNGDIIWQRSIGSKDKYPLTFIDKFNIDISGNNIAISAPKPGNGAILCLLSKDGNFTGSYGPFLIKECNLNYNVGVTTIGDSNYVIGISSVPESTSNITLSPLAGLTTSIDYRYISGGHSLDISGNLKVNVINPYLEDGNLGLGITNPTTKLQVDGTIGFKKYPDSDTINVLIGDETTGSNLLVNANSGNLGRHNNFIGVGAGSSTTTGSFNNFFGYNAGAYNKYGSSNIFIGPEAGYCNTGFYGIFIGDQAGYNNTSYSNIFIGDQAGYNTAGGDRNVFIGSRAGIGNTSGSYNVFIGSDETGESNTTGSYNTFVGAHAGEGNQTGSYNAFFGTRTGYESPYEGGYNSYRVILGVGVNENYLNFADPFKDMQLAVGLNTDGESKYWVVGNENFNVGIGTTNPETRLHVDTGSIRVGTITEPYRHNYEMLVATSGNNPGGAPLSGITTDGSSTLPGTENFIAYPETGYRITTTSGVGTVTEIPYSVVGSTYITGTLAGIGTTIPDLGTGGYSGQWNLTCPFNIQFVGVTTNKVYVSTNSYLAFQDPNDSIYPTTESINIAHEYSRGARRLYYGTGGVAPNRTFIVRFEGISTYEWNPIWSDLDITDLYWEAVFYENDPAQIDIQVQQNPLTSIIKSPNTKLQLSGPLGFTGGNVKIGDDQTGFKSRNPVDSVGNVFIGLGAGNQNECGRFNIFLGHKSGGNSGGSYNNFFGAWSGYTNQGSGNNFMGFYSGMNNKTGSHNNFFGCCAGIYGSSGSHNNYLGENSGRDNTGDYNNFLGRFSGLAHTTGSYNNFFGAFSGCNNFDGCNNNFIGNSAGRSASSSNNNNFIGCGAGQNASSGTSNNALGVSAGYGNTGSYNNFIGQWTGMSNAGFHNNFMGLSAGRYNTTGSGNNFFGTGSGYRNITGGNNNFIGPGAGATNTIGNNNNFIGYYAGYGNTSGNWNNYIGQAAGQCGTSGCYNNFFGLYAGRVNNANHNIFIGCGAGQRNTTGPENVFIGVGAGLTNTTGGDNIIIGAGAGLSLLNGDNNIFFGANAGAISTTGSNNVIIGPNRNRPIVNGSNQLAIGAGNTDWIVGNNSYRVGIGTTNPTGILHIGPARSTALNNAPLKLSGATVLATPEIGAIEYDGAFLYHTPNSTSGRAYLPPIYAFRRTSNGANIGAAIADFFTTPSSLSLEASSMYRIQCFAYFTKNTAGIGTWTQTFSSAPTIAEGYQYTTAVGGMTAATAASYTQLENYFYNQGATTLAWNPSASQLSAGVNHLYRLNMTVLTNGATNWRLRITQDTGTVTPLAGSYYTIEKVSGSTGTFAA